MRTILNVGCGIDPLPEFFTKPYTEVRLDIDQSIPGLDIVADMIHLPDGIGPFDLVFASHVLEHILPHEVAPCLEGFHRVLKPGGGVVIFVPDLEDVKATNDVLYEAYGGPISGLDLIYGFRKYLKDHPYYAHKIGFVSETLRAALEDAGFKNVTTQRHHSYNLMGVGKHE